MVCPACSGNALIRKSEIGIIKIDRVPNGERVVVAMQAAPAETPPRPSASPPPAPSAAESVSPPRLSRGVHVSSLVSAAVGVAVGATLVSGFFLFDASETIRHIARAQAAKPAPAATVASAAAPAQSEISDRVRQSAMAPQREAAPPAIARTALLVRAVGEGAPFRAGPGLAFPSVGQAEPDVKYVVADWRDRWFRVFLPGSDATVWVSADHVELITR